MASFDHSKTRQDMLHPGTGRAGERDPRTSQAVADMQERLAQFGRLVEQLRDGLPEPQAGALGRIEQGIASLAERICAFGQEGQSREDTGLSFTPTVPVDMDEPWDAQSAEALMCAYETAEAEFAGSGRQATPAAPKAAEASQPPMAPAIHRAGDHVGDQAGDQAWLEARFADMSALLQRALADINPARSLGALDRRLDQFEQRLDAALGDLASCSGREGLTLIEAHVKELAGHFEATCHQLARLDAMDGHLRELMQAVQEQRLQPKTGPATMTDDAIAAMIDSAAERAVTRLAASLPEADPQRRIDALEGLLHDYIAERRRGEDVTGGILHTIEGALTRIADRVDAMEAARSAGGLAAADGHAPDRDGIELESDRLAEAYAAGARVLGREPHEPILDAADYAPPPARIQAGPAAEEEAPAEAEAASPAGPPAEAPPDAQTRQELRASALRAKLKAQALPHEPAAASAGLDEAKASMLKDRRAGTSAGTSSWAGSHRSGLLLGAAMALLCGTGFLVVDSLLANTPPADAHPSAAGPKKETRPGAGLARPTSQPAALDWQPATEAARRGLAPHADEQRAPSAPAPPPAPRRPETVTDDLGADQPTPERRLSRLRTGSTSGRTDATPAMLSPQEPLGTGQDSARGAGDGAASPLPPTMGTAKLRSAAASGDAFAQFEVATRFAEGKGVAQDHRQAFAWYERAATRGLASAQFRLAAYFERGVGVAPDRERARVWYRRAADQGYIRAMHNLAVLSVGGGEVQPDYPTAAGWFRKAAERGLTDSQFNLGVLHENGRGVAKDLQEAYKWYALAARSGDPVAARRLDQIKARLDQAGLRAAEQRLAAWHPSLPEPGTPAADTSAGR